MKVKIVGSLFLVFLLFSPSLLHAWGFQGSLNVGTGKMSNDSGSLKERTMTTTEASVIAGYKFLFFTVGPMVNYRIVSQQTDAADVGNTNTKGKGWLAGAGATFDFLFLNAVAGVNLLGEYKLTKKDSNNNSVAYKKPFGYHLGVGYKILLVSIDLRYSSIYYGEEKAGPVKTSLSSNKVNHWNLGIGASIHF